MQRGEARLGKSSRSKASRSREAMAKQLKAQRPHAQTNRSGVEAFEKTSPTMYPSYVPATLITDPTASVVIPDEVSFGPEAKVLTSIR